MKGRPGASIDLDDELALKIGEDGVRPRPHDPSLPDRLDLAAPDAARLPVRASG